MPHRRLAPIALTLLVAAAAVGLSGAPATAQTEKLGTVDFTTSCSPAAHAQVNRAVAFLHSF